MTSCDVATALLFTWPWRTVGAVKGAGFENVLFPEYNLASAIEHGHCIVCVAGGRGPHTGPHSAAFSAHPGHFMSLCGKSW